MISVRDLFLRVQNDLARKDKAGYTSAEEFNRDLADAQNTLYAAYVRRFEETKQVADSLHNFMRTAILPIQYGRVPVPTDFRHSMEVNYYSVENGECGSPPIESRLPMPKLLENEVANTLINHIRKPNLAKKRVYHNYSYANGLPVVNVWPRDLPGSVELRYFITFPEARYGFTIDVVNDNQDYDPATTINLDWQQQDFINFVDVLLLYKGIEIRDNQLLQMVGMLKQINE